MVASDAAWSGNITSLVVDPYDDSYLFTINGTMGVLSRGLVRYPGGRLAGPLVLNYPTSLVIVPVRPAPPSNVQIDVR